MSTPEIRYKVGELICGKPQCGYKVFKPIYVKVNAAPVLELRCLGCNAKYDFFLDEPLSKKDLDEILQ